MTTPLLTTAGDARTLMDLYPELHGSDARPLPPAAAPVPSRPARRAHAILLRASTAFVVAGVLVLDIVGR